MMRLSSLFHYVNVMHVVFPFSELVSANITRLSSRVNYYF